MNVVLLHQQHKIRETQDRWSCRAWDIIVIKQISMSAISAGKVGLKDLKDKSQEDHRVCLSLFLFSHERTCQDEPAYSSASGNLFFPCNDFVFMRTPPRIYYQQGVLFLGICLFVLDLCRVPWVRRKRQISSKGEGPPRVAQSCVPWDSSNRKLWPPYFQNHSGARKVKKVKKATISLCIHETDMNSNIAGFLFFLLFSQLQRCCETAACGCGAAAFEGRFIISFIISRNSALEVTLPFEQSSQHLHDRHIWKGQS